MPKIVIPFTSAKNQKKSTTNFSSTVITDSCSSIERETNNC